jgi:hypothetical protein
VDYGSPGSEMTDYEKLIRECIAAIEKPLPSPCNETEDCRRAGGCFSCLVFMPFWNSIPLPSAPVPQCPICAVRAGLLFKQRRTVLEREVI